MTLKVRFVLTVIVCVMLCSLNVAAQNTTPSDSPKPEPVTWESKWSSGFRLYSSDGNFKLKFGGRMMNDWVSTLSYDQSLEDVLGSPNNGIEFRRLRFFNSGTIYKYVSYKLQVDFAGGDVELKDAYIAISEIPVIGHLKVGHYKEPFGLEELTSSKYITFMTRSLTTPFHPVRNTGFSIYNDVLDGKMTWAVGAFRDADDYGETMNKDHRFNLTGRITGLPWQADENLLHLGLAYQLRNPDNETVRYASEPETHTQPDFVDTGDITNVTNENIWGTEIAWIYGPFSLQGEYQASSLKRNVPLTNETDTIATVATSKFSAFYVYASLFLTKGDRRAYKSSVGAFDRVIPLKNFGEDGSIGAFELAFRFSSIDLNDGKETITDEAFTGSSLVEGGQLNNITAGLNWYLNPSTRVMFNYTFADLQDYGNLNGKAGFLRTRFQIDF